MSESVSWFALLQDTKITQFLHLCFLSLPLPHCDHDLKENKCRISSFKVLRELQYINNSKHPETDTHFHFESADWEFVERHGERKNHFIG